MTATQWFALGALACASFVVSAQPAPARPNPADASATVRAPGYQSAFDTYQRAFSEEQSSPDKVWRQANEQVARSDAHSGHAMPEAAAAPDAHSGHAMPKAATAPAAPKAPPVDHSKHH